MKMLTDKHSENTQWQIDRMKAKISQRRRTIELLKAYNQQDKRRLTTLSSYR